MSSLPAAATRQALAVIRSPDRRSAWAIVVTALAPGPISDLTAAIASVHRATPIVGARLHGETWYPGPPPECFGDDGPGLRHFNLGSEPPLRIIHTGARLTLVGHHAAFDGRGMLAVLQGLLGGPLTATLAPAGQPSATRSPLPLGRLRHAADPVAPTGRSEQLVALAAQPAGPGVTGRLAAAFTTAASEHNARFGRRWEHVGISLGVGGQAGIGNTASYRRVDVGVDDDVAAAVDAALSSTDEPAELGNPSRLLMRLASPVARRLSDSFLVSNLGRVDVPGVESIEFYPVARGRSAVAIGAVGLAGGPATITLRSMHLTRSDAERLLDRLVELLERR